MPPSPLYARLRNPVGTHVRVGKGLVKGALANAELAGAETIQPFVGNPRGWALSAGDPAQDAAFREACAQTGMRVVIHTPYLVNLGSPTSATYERSVASVRHNLCRAVEIGAEGVVVHTGSCDDLQAYLAALDHHPRAGVCLDTCHVFAAGAPLDEPGGTTATVDRLVEICGPGRLRLVHANDSMDVRGAFKDRHQRIGGGHIGLAAFEELFAHPATDGVPFVLETPGSRDAEDPQIPLLKKLRDA